MGKGRKKGSKNLEKKGKKTVNQFGVEFTEKEKKQLTNLVNSANRKRTRMLKEESQLPLFTAGKYEGKTLGETWTGMGQESDFILAKKSKSLQKFKSKKEYIKYIKNLKRVVDKDYVNKRIERYRENHIKAIRNVFGRQGAKDIIQKIKGMGIKEYMNAMQSDALIDISYVYDPKDAKIKGDNIRRALKMV
jgi:hypothetical protein